MPKPTPARRPKQVVPRTPTPAIVAAAQAKAGLLKLLDEVHQERKTITITKRGRVVAKLVPASDEPATSLLEDLMSRTAGLARTTGDLVSPDHDFWGSEWK